MENPLLFFAFCAHIGITYLAFWRLIAFQDEIGVLVALAVSYFGFGRYFAVTSGNADWVQGQFLLQIAPLNDETVAYAVALMVLGEFALILSYVFTSTNRVLAHEFVQWETALATKYFGQVLLLTWILVGVSWGTNLFLSSEAMQDVTLSLGYGYVTHVAFLSIGSTLLVFQLYLAGARRTGVAPLMYWLLWFVLFLVSFQPWKRFVLLGWVIGVLLLWSYGATVKGRAVKILLALLILAVFTAIAGAIREMAVSETEFPDAFSRVVLEVRDGNMADGFGIVLQVFPDIIPYQMGGEHFGIISRPIPRWLWPDKPLGGFQLDERVIAYDFEQVGTTGISPSLFGSFYQEGGIMGIIMLSALYGILVAKIVNFYNLRGRLVGGLGRVCTTVGLVPLLRGGDLPGNFAWLGASFLAVFAFLYVVRRDIDQAKM